MKMYVLSDLILVVVFKLYKSTMLKNLSILKVFRF